MRLYILIIVFLLVFGGCGRNENIVNIPDEVGHQIIDVGNNTEPAENSEQPVPAETVVPVEENRKLGVLSGKVICIDPGHQAKVNNAPEFIAPSSTITKEKMSWGTSGVATGVPEYKLNLVVSKKLKEAFEKEGAKIIMTREINDVDMGNIDRAKVANENNADIFLRIHADGSDNSSRKGISVLYPGKKYISDKNMLEKSKLAASKVLEGLLDKTGAVSGGIVARDDMTGFNWSKVPVILVEMGFMTNREEDKRLNTEEYQDKLVEGMVEGLKKYFEALLPK